jgi:hypothetical protein
MSSLRPTEPAKAKPIEPDSASSRLSCGVNRLGVWVSVRLS